MRVAVNGFYNGPVTMLYSNFDGMRTNSIVLLWQKESTSKFLAQISSKFTTKERMG